MSATRVSNATGETRRLALILLTAVLATLPFVIRGNSCGHDFDFHLQSWLSVAQQWSHGTLYPHWVAAANFGAGEPRLVFYPPASWMLGAALGALLPWRAAGGAFVFISLACSGLSLYALARQWTARDAAALAAGLYIVNPYSMFAAYERAAYGELLAAAWMPLILLYALRKTPELTMRRGETPDLTSPNRSPSPWRNTVPMSVAVAGVWLTNAPAAVMAMYMLALIALIAAAVERAWWPILRAISSGTLGIAVAAFYIVPAAYERRWVDIARAVAPGMRVEDSFLFGHTGEPFHDQVLHTASWIAVALLVATAAAAFTAWRKGALTRTANGSVITPRRVWIPLLALPPMILLLMLPLSDFVWRCAPELRFLQFSWRWLLVLSVAFATLCALALQRRLHLPGDPRDPATFRPILVAYLAILTLAGGLIALEQQLFWQPCDSEDMVSAQIETFRGQGFEGTDEYTTLNTDNGDIQKDLPPVRLLTSPNDDEADSSFEENPAWIPSTTSPPTHREAVLQTWSEESKAFTVNTSAPAFAVLRLLDYPAWEVQVNGLIINQRPHREDGLMTIPLSTGVSAISVRYVAGTDVRWGRAITIAALVIILLLVLRQRRSRRP